MRQWSTRQLAWRNRSSRVGVGNNYGQRKCIVSVSILLNSGQNDKEYNSVLLIGLEQSLAARLAVRLAVRRRYFRTYDFEASFVFHSFSQMVSQMY